MLTLKCGDIKKIDDATTVKLINFQNATRISKGLYKIPIQEGYGDEQPSFESTAVITFSCWYHDEEGNKVVLESDKTVSFIVGEETIADGIDRAVRSMKGGEKSIVILDAPFVPSMYPDAPKPIPIRTDLLFEVAIKSFEVAKGPWDCKTFSEYLVESQKRLKDGSIAFKEGKYELAISKYCKAQMYIESFFQEDAQVSLEQETQLNEIQSQCLSNLAAISLKRNEMESVLIHSNNAIEKNPNNLKAYYRLSLYKIHKKKYEEAKQDILYILEKEPSNQQAKIQLDNINAMIHQEFADEKRVYKRMKEKLEKSPLYEDKAVEKRATSWISNKFMWIALTSIVLLILCILLFLRPFKH